MPGTVIDAAVRGGPRVATGRPVMRDTSANRARRARQVVAAYAFRDEAGQWHGQPRLLRTGQYREAPTFIPFDPPADPYSPLGGQTFTVRYGAIAHDEDVSVYTVQVRQEDGSPLNLRMTHPVLDALFGPAVLGTPERQQWEQARERRRRELDGS
jgi:hypothetical protein